MSVNEFETVILSSEHLKLVAELEQSSFSTPISEENLRAFLVDGIGKGFVSLETKSGGVAAYGGVISVAGEAQVLNIATHPNYRRLGLGREIMQRIIEYSKYSGAEYITLEVREGNCPAINLYVSLGFDVAGKIKGYYKNPSEDALILKKELC